MHGRNFGYDVDRYGGRYVLVGHSERRLRQHETDLICRKKWEQALKAGLLPVFCVGETQEQRASGVWRSVLEQQLSVLGQSLEQSALPAEVWGKTMVAYEPVWAIGTGLAASPEQVEEVHGVIRDLLKKLDPFWGDRISVLYGGSVKMDNAPALMERQNVDGALVGEPL